MVYNINDMKEIIIEHQGTDLFPEGGQESFSEDGAVELKWKGKELAVRTCVSQWVVREGPDQRPS